MIKLGCSGCDAPLTERENYVTYAHAIDDLIQHGYSAAGDARDLRVYCAECAPQQAVRSQQKSPR